MELPEMERRFEEALALYPSPVMVEMLRVLTLPDDGRAQRIGERGCLSLQKCSLYNPGDVASTRGSSARYLLGDDPEEVVPNLAELGDT